MCETGNALVPDDEVYGRFDEYYGATLARSRRRAPKGARSAGDPFAPLVGRVPFRKRPMAEGMAARARAAHERAVILKGGV